MKTHVQPHKTHDDIVLYLPDGSFIINLDNILTCGKIVYPNMRVIKKEGAHFDAIVILDVWDDGEYVYLKVMDMKTGKVGELVQILDRENKYFLWSIIDIDYAMCMMEDKIMNRLIVGV